MRWACLDGNMTVGRTRLVPTKGEAEMDEQRVPDLEEMDEQ
jgi:hypothetical protein